MHNQADLLLIAASGTLLCCFSRSKSLLDMPMGLCVKRYLKNLCFTSAAFLATWWVATPACRSWYCGVCLQLPYQAGGQGKQHFVSFICHDGRRHGKLQACNGWLSTNMEWACMHRCLPKGPNSACLSQQRRWCILGWMRRAAPKARLQLMLLELRAASRLAVYFSR